MPIRESLEQNVYWFSMIMLLTGYSSGIGTVVFLDRYNISQYWKVTIDEGTTNKLLSRPDTHNLQIQVEAITKSHNQRLGELQKQRLDLIEAMNTWVHLPERKKQYVESLQLVESAIDKENRSYNEHLHSLQRLIN